MTDGDIDAACEFLIWMFRAAGAVALTLWCGLVGPYLWRKAVRGE